VSTRPCPVCGAPVTPSPSPRHRRVYCSDRCRWKHGNDAARERRAAARGEWESLTDADVIAWMAANWTNADLIAWLAERDPFAGPLRRARQRPHAA
jgi:hypothetical protein